MSSENKNELKNFIRIMQQFYRTSSISHEKKTQEHKFQTPPKKQSSTGISYFFQKKRRNMK